MRKVWTDEEDLKLSNLISQGCSRKEIMDEFNYRSIDSVISRIRLIKNNKTPNKIWTDDKLNFLISNSSTKTISELSNLLDIKYQTVYKKIKDLNIPYVTEVHMWTDYEDSYIKENYLRKSYSSIARKLNTSVSSVQQRARHLNLVKNKISWSKEEVEFLKNNYGKISEDDLVSYLNKPYVKIISKASKLGLNKYSGTIYKDEFIRNNFHRMTDSQIAEILKCSEFNVSRRRKSMGIYKVGNEVSGPTKIENIVKGILEDLNIGYLYNSNLDNYRPDFIITNTNKIIEVYGDYFHCNPALYPNGPKDDNQIRHIVSDYYKKCFYVSNNYDVLYLWEFDINNNLEDVINKIKQFAAV